MYIVDVNKPVGGIDAPPPPSPQPDYPSPPPNAIPFTNNGSQIPIYYNQTIVLQCLTSGVVSPILIIRKVDRQTTVVGGGNQEGAKSVPDHYCALGEVYGDPVSQLHKIAFEVYEPPKAAPEAGSPGVSGAFLSCMAEKVNTYRPVDGRQWTKSASRGSDSPAIPASPSASTPTSATASIDYFGTDSSVPPSPDMESHPNTNDGGRVRKGKRSTNSAGGITKSAAAKGRNSKRPTSAGSAGSKRPSFLDSPAGGASSGALWQVDIGETSVWTIVGTGAFTATFSLQATDYHLQNKSDTTSTCRLFSSTIKTASRPAPSLFQRNL
jgi:recombining binding protein (suppressor of hairless)